MKLSKYFAPIAIALIWLVVLSMPKLRTLLSVQVLGSNLMAWRTPFSSPEDDSFVAEKLLERFPDDANVQGSLRRASIGVSDGAAVRRNAVLPLAKVAERFPDQSWILARYAIATLTAFPDDRLGGDFEANQKPVPGVPSPETTGKPRPYSSADLNGAIEVARRGQKMEPDNAFWDWILAAHLMTARRDAEAYRVIAAGSHKALYDDHTMDTGRALIAAYERVRPLLWEEKSQLVWQAWAVYSRWRHLARLISWQAWKWEQKGDHARAIQTRLDFARLCAPMMEGRNSIISGLVATACQAIMWSGNPNRRVRNNNLKTRGRAQIAERQRLSVALFATYARAHGQDKAAREAIALGERTTRFRLSTSGVFDDDTKFMGRPIAPLQRTVTWWGFGLAALVQSTLMALALGLSRVLLLGTRRETVSMREGWRHAVPVVAFVAVIGVAAHVFAFERPFLNSYTGNGGFGAQTESVPLGVRLLLLFAIAPLLLSALVSADSARGELRPLKKQLNAPPSLYEGESQRAMPDSALPLLMRFASWGLFSLAIVTLALAVLWPQSANAFLEWMNVSHSSDDEHSTIPLIIFAATLAALCYIGWLIKWRFLSPQLSRPIGHVALRRHRAALWNLVLLSSAFYLITGLMALPSRAALDAGLKQLLQRGEIAMLTQR